MSKPDSAFNSFSVARSTLIVDRLMARIISAGGLGVIAAVLGILIFITIQIFPLFRQARMQELSQHQFPDREYAVMGVDQWTEMPFLIDREGRAFTLDLGGDQAISEQAIEAIAGETPSSVFYNQRRQEVVFGLSTGEMRVVRAKYNLTFPGNVRKVSLAFELENALTIGQPDVAIERATYSGSDGTRVAAATQVIDGKRRLFATVFKQKRSLFGGGKLAPVNSVEFTDQLSSDLNLFRVSNDGELIAALTADQAVTIFKLDRNEFKFYQRFEPFADFAGAEVSSMEFLLGDVSLVFGEKSGQNRIYSLFVSEGHGIRLFGHTKTLPNLPVGPSYCSISLRNKAFVTGEDKHVSLRYGTSAEVRWSDDLDYRVVDALIASKYNRIVMLDDAHKLHVWELDDPHPESGFNTFFGKTWFEGYAQPGHEWQSTGGTDDFEPKLSMIPLIVGTLKGTLYALLFAVPIALLAGIYTSQFLVAEWRQVVKPVMEIMASLPSVVLGFLAALWLAPLIADRVPSLLLFCIALPFSAVLAGAISEWLSRHCHLRRQLGLEAALLVPVIMAVWWATWELGPVLEQYCFLVKDPSTGKMIADFRLWWPQFTDSPFEQRNALVVGFIMGFAVIPIIFTLTEDSLSNVPKELTSASLALGASRWQTATRVVLPTASPGIFSAIMIGLGRAVGETMIVLMATGNTAIMEWNIFNGMRTLSANIAVELPEAPHGGTLYRALFLGALLLFIMTFVVNTFAELMRQYLRERYKTV